MIWLTNASGHASMWTDPGWEEMLQKSELIALVEVIEGGTFVAKVRPLRVFKGEMKSEFHVTGFNNDHWPEHAVKAERFGKKQRLYLFLRQREEAAHHLQLFAESDRTGLKRNAFAFVTALTGWRFGSGRYAAAIQAAKAGLLWSVWTPTAGDLPVEQEKELI